MRKQIGKITKASEESRQRRKLSIRKKISGTADRPRICLQKSNKHLLAQVIDDCDARTILTVKTFGKNSTEGMAKNRDGAVVLGGILGRKLLELKINTVVFDRNGYKYTGIVESFANAIREAGIKF